MDNNIEEFHTGLFIDLNKRGVLLDIVQDLLRKQYDVVAITGPSLSNCTCEILLRPLKLFISYVDIANAQVLLEKYLNMINQSRPKMFVRQEPELIDLGASDDDEAMDDHSVVIVDVEESNVSAVAQNSEKKSSPNATMANSDITVVDSLRNQNSPSELSFSTANAGDISTNSRDGQEKSASIINLDDSDVIVVNTIKSNSPSKLPSSSVGLTADVLNDSQQNRRRRKTFNQNLVDSDIVVVDSIKRQNSLSKSPSSSGDMNGNFKKSIKQGKKRKRNLEKDFDKGIDIVEILDEEVIIVEDSFTTSNPSRVCSIVPEPEHSVEESNKSLNSEKQSPQSESQSNPDCTTSRCDAEGTSTHTLHPDSDQSTYVNQNVLNIGVSECESSHVDKSLSSGPPKKKSKLAYHRPAHLVKPLTLPAPGVSSSRTESSSNIYNPNADTTEKRTGLRPIVIDGNNVAIGHGKGSFSLKGIQICINYFEKRGHRQIKVFIPHYRKNRDNYDVLQNMERKGLLVTTPSRKVSGKIVASYDDRYIVQYAAEFGGVIVSTDNFRDLLSENPNWKETIENRLLMFTWVDDLLMFPQDPLGRRGPSLEDFLKFPDT